MKTLIISDTHLTSRFDKNKYLFLEKIINNCDRLIVNGDFWDSWFTSFDGFVKSEWKNIFPLLLQKKTIYIYGNHDPKSACDARVKLFSVRNGDETNVVLGKNEFHIEHGNKILKGKKTKFLELYSGILDKVDSNLLGKFIHYFLHILEIIGFGLIGPKLMMGSKLAYKNNQIIKTRVKNGKWLICGDTHYPEIDKNVLFANSGTINYGYATYIVVDDDEVNLIKTRY